MNNTQTLDIKEIEKAMDEKKQAIEECENKIDKLLEDKDTLEREYYDLERQFNRLIYKEVNIKVNSYYYLKTEEYGYHDKKEILICVDKIEDEDIWYREFIIKDDDGDTYFYIERIHGDLIEFIKRIKENFIEVDKDKAQALLDSFLKIYNEDK